MRRRARRQGTVPLAFAVLLTFAAGLSLAEEHAWAPEWTPEWAAMSSSDLSSKGATPDKDETARKPDPSGMRQHEQAVPKLGVGSRALTGHAAQDPAVEERPNTHLDDRSQSLD